MSSEPNPEDARLKAYLFDLLEVGAKLTQDIARQTEQPAPTASPNKDRAEQFERVSRAMRRTILLIRHITANSPASKRTQARKQIIRAVEDVIQRKRDPNEAEPLEAEFRERLDAPDLDEEIDTRPVADIITDITRDLGLAHFPGTNPWRRRTPRDLQALNTQAARPTPQQPYNPAPHGPDPGAAPQPPHKPPDLKQKYEEMRQLAKMLSGT